MFGRLNSAVVGLFFLVSVGLMGCPSPATTAKPDAPPPESKKVAKAPAKKETPPRDTSLDALKKGEVPREGPLKEIYFAYDKYDLSNEARATLKASAGWLKGNPGARAEIEGHCDERGTNEYNLALGAKRAQAAKDYLVSLGIVAGRLSTISYGEEVPVCREQTEACWQRNRRARFVVTTARPGS